MLPSVRWRPCLILQREVLRLQLAPRHLLHKNLQVQRRRPRAAPRDGLGLAVGDGSVVLPRELDVGARGSGDVGVRERG